MDPHGLSFFELRIKIYNEYLLKSGYPYGQNESHFLNGVLNEIQNRSLLCSLESVSESEYCSHQFSWKNAEIRV